MAIGGTSAGAGALVRGTVSTAAAGAMPSRAPVPSKPNAETRPRPTVNSAAGMRRSDIRIGPDLRGAARVRDRPAQRRTDLLGVFPQISGREIRLARRPAGATPIELGGIELHVERARMGVDLDDVAIAHQRDRPADRRLRPDMADAEAARRAREPPVGNERNLAARALAVKGRGGGQHLAHAGAALGALVADHEHVAFPVLTRLHGLETRFFAIETAGR